MSDYNSIPGLNWSTLKLCLGRTAAHAKAKVYKDSTAMRFGRAVHCACLEPAEFIKWEVVEAKTTTKPSAITAQEAVDLAYIRRNWEELGYTVTHRELTIQWNIDGTPCKGRIDAIGDGFLLDLKTCKDASPAAFAREVASRHYHAQMAWYYDGLIANGFEIEGAMLIALEKEAPYAIGDYDISEWLNDGRRIYRDALSTYLSDTPAHYGRNVPLPMPKWMDTELTINAEGGIDL